MLSAPHRRAALACAALLAASGPILAQGFTSARVVSTETFVSLDRVPPGSDFRLALALRIQEGWHVNSDRPTFDYLIATSLAIEPESAAGWIELQTPIYPPPIEKAFAFTDGRKLRVYEATALMGLRARAAPRLPAGPRELKGTLTVQACNDNSCLAPARLPVQFAVSIAAAGQPINATHPEVFDAIPFGPDPASPRTGAGPGSASEPDSVGRLIDERGWAVALGFIFLWGLALNLTPCVYPVIPITLAYFGGQASGRPSRTFLLAAIYVLGMCLTYSTLGVVAALTGSLFGSILQNPLSLLFVAGVMLVLALSMFGLYDIQVPAALRQRISSRPGLTGALFMGLTVGLVAAPCVGPIVVSLLVYVGRTASPVVGFWLFFVLSLGLGVPYLFLGGFAGAATGLPRAGIWMEWVKKVFGCILVAMAIYFINPLLPEALSRLTLPAVLVLSGLYVGVLEGSPIRTRWFRLARLATAAACAAAAILLVVPSSASAGVAWEPYGEAALARAAAEGRPVIIDFTADWCLPCKELEHLTFTDEEVVRASDRFVRLKADITRTGSGEVQALQQRHEILGAPTIVFVDSRGRERSDLRLTGFEDARGFLQRMNQVD